MMGSSFFFIENGRAVLIPGNGWNIYKLSQQSNAKIVFHDQLYPNFPMCQALKCKFIKYIIENKCK